MEKVGTNMDFEMRTPMLGNFVDEVIVAKWYKRPNDFCGTGELLVDLECDKAVLEIMAPTAGILDLIVAPEGGRVRSGSLLGLIRPNSVSPLSGITSGPIKLLSRRRRRTWARSINRY